MRYSSFFIPTLKETPSDAEVVSHQLMMRAGMIRKVSAGIYTYMPLGLRSIRKFEQIVREEMNRAGAIELLMPGVQPAELWIESRRWGQYGKELLRFTDRKDNEFCLGPTHEEVITDIARRELKSYRQMPVNFYQIQTKFRDEIRPRFGLMRGREFIMKDAYSFDLDSTAANLSYDKMYQAYNRIFERCGLNFRAVEADTGSIGGSASHEFMVLASSGEDAIVSCNACRYAANVEKAEGVQLPLAEAGQQPLAKVHTPDAKTIAEVAAFLKRPQAALIKTLICSNGEGQFVMALVQGDHELNELKLKNHLGWDDIRMATDEEILRFTGSPPGFLGPIDLKEELQIVADFAVAAMSDVVVGANEVDRHYTGVSPGRDLRVTSSADIRLVGAGDPCPRCDSGTLEVWRGIEVGHVFKLGTKYSTAMNASYLDKDGKEQTIFMGCYGIGIGRTVAAAIEQNHDENGIIWPLALAPFHCSVVVINAQKDEAALIMGQQLHDQLEAAGVEVLLDDRDERPGFKFKDHDLIGVPLRIVVGGKNLADGKVEFKLRSGGEMELLTPDEAADRVISLVRSTCGGVR
jgi:prolyl-tRNA synthetase